MGGTLSNYVGGSPRPGPPTSMGSVRRLARLARASSGSFYRFGHIKAFHRTRKPPKPDMAAIIPSSARAHTLEFAECFGTTLWPRFARRRPDLSSA